MTPEEWSEYQAGIDTRFWRDRLVFWLDWRGRFRQAKRLAAKYGVPY